MANTNVSYKVERCENFNDSIQSFKFISFVCKYHSNYYQVLCVSQLVYVGTCIDSIKTTSPRIFLTTS